MLHLFGYNSTELSSNIPPSQCKMLEETIKVDINIAFCLYFTYHALRRQLINPLMVLQE